MKKDIHPQYFEDTKAVCACGNTFITGSTKKEINVEVCYQCHPFYLGEQRYIDIKGRVDQFKKRQKTAQKFKAEQSIRKPKRQDKEQKKTKSLKELLSET